MTGIVVKTEANNNAHMAKDGSLLFDTETGRMCETLREPVNVLKSLSEQATNKQYKFRRLYRNFYKHDDHVAIRNVLDSVQANWIVSYDNCPEIKEIYYGYTQDDYILNYSAYHKMKGSEVMIYGPSIKSIGTPNAQLTLGIA